MTDSDTPRHPTTTGEDTGSRHGALTVLGTTLVTALPFSTALLLTMALLLTTAIGCTFGGSVPIDPVRSHEKPAAGEVPPAPSAGIQGAKRTTD